MINPCRLLLSQCAFAREMPPVCNSRRDSACVQPPGSPPGSPAGLGPVAATPVLEPYPYVCSVSGCESGELGALRSSLKLILGQSWQSAGRHAGLKEWWFPNCTGF